MSRPIYCNVEHAHLRVILECLLVQLTCLPGSRNAVDMCCNGQKADWLATQVSFCRALMHMPADSTKVRANSAGVPALELC
jgi:hypothetical protein